MKKILSIVALMAVLLTATSAYNQSDSLAIGDRAPEFSVSNGYGTFNLNKCDGQYLLLTFWSSSDAKSRIDCNKYSHLTEDAAHNHIKHIAINFDSHPELFQEVVRLDRLDSKAQYYVEGQKAADIRLLYGLLEGYGSLLVGPDGRILAFNPSQSDLSSL